MFLVRADLLLSPRFLYFCRHACDYGVSRHILAHNGTSSNDCAVANSDASENDRVRPEPNITAYFYRLCINWLRVDRRVASCLVLIGNNAHARSDQGLITDINTTGSIDDAEVIDFHSIAEPNTAFAALNVSVTIDCYTVTENYTRAT